MVTDTLSQSSRYAALHSRFAFAFEFLEEMEPDVLDGRYDIQGDHCFALVQTYDSKPHEKAKFEAHRRYIDIQFILSGQESILWSPVSGFAEVTLPYAEEKDVSFYATPAHFVSVNMRPRQFAIFFPEDGHAPGLEWGGNCEVRKVVIKVEV